MSLFDNFAAAASLLHTSSPGGFCLFTLRHGQSLGQLDINAYSDIGDDNIPITRLGVRQSMAAGDILADIAGKMAWPSFQILTSTGKRSGHTARVIYDVLTRGGIEATLTEDPRLDKQKFGLFDGLFTRKERFETHPEAYKAYAEQEMREGEFHARPPEGESIADVQTRIADSIADLQRCPVPTIIVTHGTNTLCIENILMKRGEDWVMSSLDKRPNCSIHLLREARDGVLSSAVVADYPLESQEAKKALKTFEAV